MTNENKKDTKKPNPFPKSVLRAGSRSAYWVTINAVIQLETHGESYNFDYKYSAMIRMDRISLEWKITEHQAFVMRGIESVIKNSYSRWRR